MHYRSEDKLLASFTGARFWWNLAIICIFHCITLDGISIRTHFLSPKVGTTTHTSLGSLSWDVATSCFEVLFQGAVMAGLKFRPLCTIRAEMSFALSRRKWIEERSIDCFRAQLAISVPIDNWLDGASAFLTNWICLLPTEISTIPTRDSPLSYVTSSWIRCFPLLWKSQVVDAVSYHCKTPVHR